MRFSLAQEQEIRSRDFLLHLEGELIGPVQDPCGLKMGIRVPPQVQLGTMLPEPMPEPAGLTNVDLAIDLVTDDVDACLTQGFPPNKSHISSMLTMVVPRARACWAFPEVEDGSLHTK